MHTKGLFQRNLDIKITFILLIRRRSHNPRNIDAENDDETLNIGNYDIRKTEQMKLLGVYIDENLNFGGHISELCMRASKKVGMLVRLRNLILCNAKLMLYKTPYVLN